MLQCVAESREWSQLKELINVLQPFAEATDLTQGEKVVTISAVLPCVLSLNHHLEKLKTQVRFLGNLIRSLQRSLNRRFFGIFVNMKMARASRDGATAPFSDTIYLKAAVLDPCFAMMWLDHDVLVDDEVKEQVVEMVKSK
ncbi:hypothetical protein AAFF_G00006450 [Aldrovandia affinis]|uniref:Uncharacterized protein n=1 Tax=Aldrovandia affinis TaxID=143900 RepID=A0AAD7TDX5_9TELE|nr:hypothetical protein AAFF_G00006450 [Aldrovandia affinis]